jgi:hypothetical protein
MSRLTSAATIPSGRPNTGLIDPIPSGLSKAPEGWRTPRRFALSEVTGIRASVLDCGGPPPLFHQSAQGYPSALPPPSDFGEKSRYDATSPPSSDSHRHFRFGAASRRGKSGQEIINPKGLNPTGVSRILAPWFVSWI